MLRIMCTAKIHRAVVTQCELDYIGSITIDNNLLEAADILPGERVDVANLNNGSRFQTYIFKGEAGSGTICLNGAAARLAQVGDKVIVMAYRLMEDAEARKSRVKNVHVDENNRIVD